MPFRFKSGKLIRMSSPLLTKYDRLQAELREAETAEAAAKSRHDDARAVTRAARKALEKARAEIDRAISIADSPPTATGKAAPAAPAPTASPVKAPGHVRPSFRELILAFPEDGDTGHEEVGKTLGLKYSAVNSRLHKAKKAGLVESAGWGRYRLTDAGKAARGQRLQLVPTGN